MFEGSQLLRYYGGGGWEWNYLLKHVIKRRIEGRI
jgi:hypothetical protein